MSSGADLHTYLGNLYCTVYGSVDHSSRQWGCMSELGCWAGPYGTSSFYFQTNEMKWPSMHEMKPSSVPTVAIEGLTRETCTPSRPRHFKYSGIQNTLGAGYQQLYAACMDGHYGFNSENLLVGNPDEYRLEDLYIIRNYLGFPDKLMGTVWDGLQGCLAVCMCRRPRALLGRLSRWTLSPGLATGWGGGIEEEK